MPSANNSVESLRDELDDSHNNKVIALHDFRADRQQHRVEQQQSEQERVDDIGARTFLFLRNAAEEEQLEMKTVIAEHMLGLAMVVSAVEGKEQAKALLKRISEQLD